MALVRAIRLRLSELPSCSAESLYWLVISPRGVPCASIQSSRCVTSKCGCRSGMEERSAARFAFAAVDAALRGSWLVDCGFAVDVRVEEVVRAGRRVRRWPGPNRV